MHKYWALPIPARGRCGKHSRATPHELVAIGECVGFDGLALARASRLIAKVDSATGIRAISPWLPDDGHYWVVIQERRRIGLLLLDKVRGELRNLQLLSFCDLGDERQSRPPFLHKNGAAIDRRAGSDFRWSDGP